MAMVSDRRTGSKWCPQCGAYLPINDFGINRTRNDGSQPWCRKCVNKHNRATAKKNKEKWAKLGSNKVDK